MFTMHPSGNLFKIKISQDEIGGNMWLFLGGLFLGSVVVGALMVIISINKGDSYVEGEIKK